MSSQAASDDALVFAPEDGTALPGPPRSARERFWRVLIVDDDEDVHATTVYALSGTTILHRPLQFVHAYSAEEAKQALRTETDIAAILLDVVMEREDAGLQLVQFIRKDLGLTEARIILRTGQPGYAPELEAIRDYDINDYKTKSELTRTRLYTTLTAAIRSYDQIRAINTSRRGLDLIVRASNELMAMHGLQSFAAGVITQIAALLGIQPEGLVCAQDNGDRAEPGNRLVVIAAAGRFEALMNRSLDFVEDERIRTALRRCLQERRSEFTADTTTLYFGGKASKDLAAFIATDEPINDIDRRLLEVFCGNITVGLENVALFSRLHDYAFYDQLSRLPNRNKFISLLDEWLAEPRLAPHMLVLIDVDGFGEINDALGFRYGDRLLQAVADRISTRMGNRAIVARIASDTFGVVGRSEFVTPDIIFGLFAEPFPVNDDAIRLTATAGLVELLGGEMSGADALKAAGIALKRAKSRHRGEHVFYTIDMATETEERVRLLRALRASFDEHRLFLVYQPQVALDTGHVTGVEALLRWKTEEGRFVPPSQFIPVAEHSGLIVSIGDWVLRSACRELMRLDRSGAGGLRMAVNVSLAQFRHPRFIEAVHDALTDTGVDPARLELEITESMAMEDADFVVSVLDRLKGLGINIAIDDFGTGFSSLSYLRRLRVDRLKIDRAFVHEITEVERGGFIAEMVTQLGLRLGLTVIAEGVETPAQAELLKALGCHEAQGYFYAEPMEAERLADWIRKRTA